MESLLEIRRGFGQVVRNTTATIEGLRDHIDIVHPKGPFGASSRLTPCHERIRPSYGRRILGGQSSRLHPH